MHTFFINTSKKPLNEYDVLFDIHYERKSFVSMDCAMSDWFDNDKGYIPCVKRMSDMIEGYVELNNAFNLILYIDLCENQAYSSIQRDEFHDDERGACCRAMHILFTHVINESIVSKLEEFGRRPQNVLILFGEEKRFANYHSKPREPSTSEIMGKLFGFIGLPEENVVVSIAKEIDSGESQDKVAAFREKILSVWGKELVPGIRDSYRAAFELWCDELIHTANPLRASETFYGRIQGINETESGRMGIEAVSCPYDFYACLVNKSAFALSQLNIALHLLKCVEANSIYESGGKEPIKFYAYSVHEIAPLLKAKATVYAEKANEIDTLAKLYTELGLAPPVRAFDCGKFGLDEYGVKAVELVAHDAQPEKKKENNADASKEAGDTIIVKGNSKKVSLEEKQGRRLFTREEYQAFDYNYDQGSDQMLKSNATPEQYIAQAKETRKHHLNYLKKLQVHISQVLSNYAGKSKENKPALLQVGGYRYARQETEEEKKNKKALEAAESVSGKAYESMVDQYMAFCAGRSVAITDIAEQCDWFISRVHQIQESLIKLKLVAIGLLIGIILLYVPFVVIQFEAIVENILTVSTALGSVAIPIALLYFIFTAAALALRKKYIKAWEEFKEKSDKVLEENKIAVEKYDQLLSIVIPAFRWVYEYKLDVAYCAECCIVADAKIVHHRGKLLDRVKGIQNILSDLEYIQNGKEETREKETHIAEEIDYNEPFCSGKTNLSFYAVIDKSFFAKENQD